MKKKILTYCYGSGTSCVRITNLIVNLIWVYLILAHLGNVVSINLKSDDSPGYELLAGLACTTCVLTALSFSSAEKTNMLQRIKHISLLLGAVVQLLLTVKYVNAYPPFDIMTIVTVGFAIWFTGGAFYIKHQQERNA